MITESAAAARKNFQSARRLGNSWKLAEIIIPGVNLRNQGETSGTVPVFNREIKKGKACDYLWAGYIS